jgi:agmatine/peptidylarginine deiminase
MDFEPESDYDPNKGVDDDDFEYNVKMANMQRLIDDSMAKRKAKAAVKRDMKVTKVVAGGKADVQGTARSSSGCLTTGNRNKQGRDPVVELKSQRCANVTEAPPAVAVAGNKRARIPNSRYKK